MKIKVEFEIEVPDGTTHYFGELLEEPAFLKLKVIAGFNHWFF